nr:MAG TPA: hypothetical protein [Ackermannviridae sp.]
MSDNECIIQEALTGAEFEDFDIFIFHKEYEDVKDEIDALVEHARDRALTDYRITSEGDILRYYDETCHGHENDPDVQEGRKRFEDDPLGMLHQLLDTMSDNWAEYNGYYFVVGAW